MVSQIFRKWIVSYPDSLITKQYTQYGDAYIGSAGHFAQALARGDLEEAFARADFDNLGRLQKLVGKTKAEYYVEKGIWPASARGQRYIDPYTGVEI